MEAVFIVKPDEFDENLFKQIKSLLNAKNNLEITISINEQSKGILRKETREEYFARLDNAIKNLRENVKKSSLYYYRKHIFIYKL